MSKHTLGDGPVSSEYAEMMKSIASAIDHAFNSDAKGDDKTTGFILMVFPFNDHGGRCNYMSNAQREDVVVLLKEQLARFQGQPEVSGRA